MPGICEAFQAIIEGDVDGLKRLVTTKGLKLHSTFRGSTALSVAVCHNHLPSVCVLLQSGAPIDQKSRDRLDRIETPLISAIRLGLKEIVQVLISNGAKLGVQDFYHQTPLCMAVNELRISLVKLLLKEGAPIDFRNSLESPLNHVMQFINYKAQREVAMELVAAGLYVGLMDILERTPLFWAVHHADFKLFFLLIEAGSPFHFANNEKDMKIPYPWLENSETVLLVDEEGRIPPPLTRLCRTFIRNYMRRTHNRDVRPLLKKLPLPPLLVDYLLLKDVLVFAGLQVTAE